MKENNEEIIKLADSKDMNIIHDEEDQLIEERKKTLDEQDKRLRDKTAAEVFEEKQAKKYGSKKAATTETAEQKSARLDKILSAARKNVAAQMSDKKKKKNYSRALIRSRMLANNKDFWDQMRRDPDADFMASKEDKEQERQLIEREFIAAKLQHKANLLAMIVGNDKLMNDPDVAAIMKEITAMEDLFVKPINDLSDTVELSTAYGQLTAHMGSFFEKRKNDKKQLPGMEYVTELFGLIQEEQQRLNEDLNSWNKDGKLPLSIQSGSDIIERKHIGRMYEGKGRHDLIKTKIKVLSLKRENGDEDSPSMKAVKEALKGLSYALKVQINFNDEQDAFKRQQDYVRMKYDDLVKACNDYLTKHKNPHTDDGKERKAVIQELLTSVKSSRITVPAAARSYKKWNKVEGAEGQFDGASWVDAYSMSDKVKRHVVERLIASDKPNLDLNEVAQREAFEKMQAEYEAELKRVREEQEKSGEAARKKERELFRKRYKPNFAAREFFLKTGIWDPNAKDGQELKKDQKGAEKWVIGSYHVPLADLIKSMDDNIITDEEFMAEVVRMNEAAVKNDEWLQDPENIALIRDKFKDNIANIFDLAKEKDRREYNEFVRLINLNYEEVDKEIVTFYRKTLNFGRATEENGARFFLTDEFTRSKTFVNIVQPINKLRKRLSHLEKDLGLSKRGDVYKTDAIKYLMFSDKAEDGYKENLSALKKQVEGNEKMLKDLVSRKFSILTSDTVYTGLLEFLGDKTLFLSHRQLRTYAESYLRVLNVTNKETMRLERDFNEAYAETVKGPFAKYLKPYAAEYLVTKPYAKYDKDNVKDRKKAMKQDLAMVAVVNEAFLNATADAEMTEAGWKRLTELAGQFIKKELYKAQNVDEKAHEKEKYNRKGYEWALKENFEWNKGTEEYLEMDLQRILRAEVKDQVEKKSAEDIQKKIDEITKKEKEKFDKLIVDRSLYAEGEVDRMWAERLKEALDEQFGNDKQNAVFEKNYKEAIKNIPKDRRKELEKDQKEKSMKQYLKEYQVADFKDYAERGLISHQEYVDLLNSVDDYPKYRELGLLTPEEYSERLQTLIKNTIKNNNKKPENKDKQKISRAKYFHEREIEEKKKPPILVDSDFSYANMFKTTGVLENEDVVKAIPDEKMRKFLGENIGAILVGNPALTSKFPFMKGIKGLDQLDNLTYGQFELVMEEIRRNITDESKKGALAAVLDVTNKKKQEVMLLNFVKSGLNEEEVKEIGRQFDERKKKKALLDRQRRLIDLGGKYVPRDGKIRFRFEDMPDRDKNILNSWFGKGKGWLVQREKRFDNASRVWNELEKIGPEAVEQVRQWFIQAYINSEGDFDKTKTELENIAKLMTLPEAKLNKSRVYYGVDEKIEKAFIARHKEKTGNSTEMVEGDLLQLIKHAFVSVGEKTPIEFFEEDTEKNKKIDKEQKKLMSVSNFMLEMSLLNTQDVIFGHGGKGMEDFFTYNGKAKDDEYDLKLMKWAKEAHKRVTLMDSHLGGIKKNPKLYKEMSDKLIKRYMEMDVKQDAKKEKYLDACEKKYADYSRQYKEISKEYEESAKVLQEFLKQNGKIATANLDKEGAVDEARRSEQQAVIAQIQIMTDKNSEYLKELGRVSKKKTQYEKAREDTIKELYQMDSERSLQDAIKENIFADGTYSDEMCDLLELYESRKNLLSTYGKGELASLWDAFEKDDDTFMALMDPVESVAIKKIEELYAKVGPLGESISLQYDYVGRFFLEENLPAIISGKSKLLEGLKETGDDFRAQKQYWDRQLLQFQNKYLAQKKQNTKSINENIEAARKGLVKGLAKYLYYNESSIEIDANNQTKKFRKWWFFESHNYGMDKLLEKDTSSHSMIAMNHAANIVKNFVEGELHNKTDLLQYATNLGSLKDYYSNTVLPRIIENDKMAERAFLRYVMEEEYNKKPVEAKPDMFNPHPGLTDNEIMEALAQLSAEEQASIEKRLVEFKDNIRAQMVNLDEEEFKAKSDEMAKDYVENTKKELEEDFSFTEEHRKAAKEREKKREDARIKVKIEKYKGRKAYNEKLFSGKLDMLKEFGEKKQSIVYVPDKAKMAKMIKSKGELKDDKLFEQAMEQFIRIDGGEPYPDILAELLDEYCRIHDRFLENLDAKTDWIIGKEKDVVTETRRLKFIYEGAKRNNVPMEYMNFAITYAAKFARKDGVANKLEDSILLNKDVDKAMKDAVRGLTKISELEAIPVSNRALKLAHTDSIEKLKAWMFATEEKDERMFQELDGMVDRQKNYYMYADQAYAVLDKVIEEDGYIGGLDNVYKTRYINAMHDYFTERIINESENYLSGQKEFDAKSLTKEAKALIKDEWARDALVMEKNSVSNKDFESQHVFAGQLTRGDFERALVMSKKKDLINAYNELDEDQRQILAMGLYLSTTHERGSGNVIYGQKQDDRQDQRDQLMRYIGGEQVKFTVDYGRAVRALQAQSRGYKLSADTELFNKALDFTKMISAKKEQLRPKDWEKITDSYHSMVEGDKFRYYIAGDYKGIVSNLDLSRSGDLSTALDFFSMLEDLHISDRKREKDQGKIGSFIRHIKQTKEGSKVNSVIERISKYTNTQQSLLIYLLQDRSVLDFTSAGKDPVTGITAHANSEKRFKLFEKLLTDEGRNEAAEESASPDMYQTALNTLLSFQIRDDVELGNKLKESDFVQSSLHRLEAVDWELLTHACDFLEEIESERNKKVVLAHVGDEVKNAKYDSYKKIDKMSHLEKRAYFYGSRSGSVSRQLDGQFAEGFTSAMLGAYNYDRKELGEEADDLMGAFMSLDNAEKALFIKALQNRDILDVSQKNLYKNVFGIAERDFVDVKGRDALIDEYLESTRLGKKGMMRVESAEFDKALLNLCTVQVNDDMDFSQMHNEEWIEKNVGVNNQLAVFQRSTILDWKLFKRALQFVTRAVNERKMAAGDEELYRALGDQSAGEMKFDRKYLRRNLHHTGARFMRFLAKEGLDQVSTNLGSLGTLANLSEYVVSKKTANFLHEEANEIMGLKTEKEEEIWKKEAEEEDKKEDKKEEGKPAFLGNLAAMALSFDDNKRKIMDMAGKLKDGVNSINEYRGIEAVDKEEEARKRRLAGEKKKDALDAQIADLEEERVDKLKEAEQKAEDVKITGIKYVDMVLRYSQTAQEISGMLDKYLVENPNMLEKVDKYIDSYLGGLISTKTMGEYYGNMADWSKEKSAFLNKVCLDNHIPDAVKEVVDSTLGVLEKSGEFLESVSKYVDSGAKLLGDFMDIVGSVSNIKKLNAAKKDAEEKKSEDDEKIAGVDAKEFDKELIKFAQGNNNALLTLTNDLSKDQSGRKILSSIGSISQSVAKYTSYITGGVDVSQVIGAAFRTADFIWKCFADNKTVYNYYSTAGNPVLEKLVTGKSALRNTTVGERNMKEENHYHEKDGTMHVGRQEFRLVRNGQGFERDDEIADYLKLNMVHSLIFSASKFNPLAQSRVLAQCTLSILGISESDIGKTDADTAMKIYNKFKA